MVIERSTIQPGPRRRAGLPLVDDITHWDALPGVFGELGVGLIDDPEGIGRALPQVAQLAR